MSKLVSVSRPISSLDHRQLWESMPGVNRRLPEHVSLKWRRLGAVGITLLERGEYQRALDKDKGTLKELSEDEVLQFLNYCKEQSPTASGSLEVPTAGVSFLGRGEYRHVAYELKSSELFDEREAFTGLIDRLNERNSGWRSWQAHVSIATVGVEEQDSAVLEAFERIRLPTINFLPVVTKIT